jgi:hypothetical protein
MLVAILTCLTTTDFWMKNKNISVWGIPWQVRLINAIASSWGSSHVG